MDLNRKGPRVSHFQWEIVLDEVEKDPSLFTGYKNSARGREANARLWRDLARNLNSQGSGANKTPQEWATWFNNVRSKLKKKVSDNTRDTRGTGGGQALAETLTDLELRLVNLFGSGFGQGLPAVRVELAPYQQSPPENDEEVLEEEPVLQVIEVLPEPEPESEILYEINQRNNGSEIPAPAAVERPITVAEADSPSTGNRNGPPLPRRTRRRQRTRPLAPLDEANRILSQIESQRVASEGAIAQALHLIGTNLGRIASALEQNAAHQ